MQGTSDERLSREERERIQFGHLKTVLRSVENRLPVIRERWRLAGVSASDLTDLEDLRHFPFMTQADLQETYPTGLFGAPLSQVARIQGSSGTRGKPTLVGYSRNDLEIWSECVARSLALAGARPGELLHNAYGYGLFTGGLGLHQGAERLGLSVLPASGGLTLRQILLLDDLHPQGIACTPSYLVNIVETARDMGKDPRGFGLRWAVLGAEPWSESTRAFLEEATGADCLDIYGLSEVIGPGVASECHEAKSGLHIQEDHFLVEVLDPERHEPVPLGQVGELCFTTLTREVSPVVRYRTGDLASLTTETCACGRTTARMSRVRGRTDDMIVVRGVNVFPSEVEAVLSQVEGLGPNWRMVLRRPRALDTVTVEVEGPGPDTSEGEGSLAWERLKMRAERGLREKIGVAMAVSIVHRGVLPRSEGKTVRVRDEREPTEAVRPQS